MSEEIHFDSYAALHENLGRLLRASQHSVDIFDPTGRDLALGGSDFSDLTHDFLLAGGRMNIVVHDTEYIEASCPRLLSLLRYRSHQMAIQRTSEDLRHIQETLVIGDDQHLLRRFHSDYARGALELDSGESGRPWRARFQEIWNSSAPAVSFTTLGL